jgi:hypothetical protein
MRRYGLRLIGGILLIAAGIFMLLDRFGIMTNILPYVWIVLFTASGVVFLLVYATDRRHWWALIPGLTLLGLGVVSGSEVLLPDLLGELGGAIFLGGIALSFWLIFALHREHWWAGIPAGVLTTLAVVAGTGSSIAGIGSGVVFFIGLGLTFLLLFIVPAKSGRMTWPLIPAAILLVMGVILATPYLELLNYLGPAALILGGGYFLYRSLRGSNDADEGDPDQE